jgi:hypothetical protein
MADAANARDFSIASVGIGPQLEIDAGGFAFEDFQHSSFLT